MSTYSSKFGLCKIIMPKSLDDVLKEVSRELDKLGKSGLGASLPHYTSYDGLRVVESKQGKGTSEATHHENGA
jgi:hypothetical protein